MHENRFREDLFYRLHIFPLHVPPLREHREDIPCLVSYFMERCCAVLDRKPPVVDQEAIDVLTQHNWPGNVRELESVVKKMIILSSETYRGLKITVENNGIELVSINPELGDAQERLEVEYQGEKLELGFNSKYFIDVLQVMESNEVELGLIDNASPCLITGKADQGFLGLIMPMRI